MGIGSVVAVDSNGDIDYSSVSDSRELHDISDKSSIARSKSSVAKVELGRKSPFAVEVLIESMIKNILDLT